MANIVVFGKPRAFESYEYVFDGDNQSVENVHREPILKPKRYDEAILHYFARDGYAGLEYYTRAKGFESERDGIVFGVSMKSSSDFNISKTVFKLLQPFWLDFASALLDDNNRFVEDSITNQLKSTKWSQSEIDTICSTSLSNPIQAPTKGLLLLVSPQLDDIKSVEHAIKEHGDVYLSGNIDIFKDPINEIVLKEADNQIHQIQDGKIVPVTESPQPDQQSSSQQSVFGRIAKLPIWGNNQNAKKKIGSNRRKIDSYGIAPIQKRAIAIVAAIVLAVFITYHFWPDNPKPAENQPHNGQVAPDTEIAMENSSDDLQDADAATEHLVDNIHATAVKLASYSAPIREKLNLRPQILPENCSSVASDISFTVSNDSFVHIDTENYWLVVDKRPRTDTKVKVEAYINGELLGSEDYTIANENKDTNVTKSSTSGTRVNNSEPIIPDYNGQPRTLEQYLNDLERGLDNNTLTPSFVESECQKFLNSSYNLKADNLRSKARNKKNSEPAKSVI